jgi:hypothetical protein
MQILGFAVIAVAVADATAESLSIEKKMFRY